MRMPAPATQPAEPNCCSFSSSPLYCSGAATLHEPSGTYDTRWAKNPRSIFTEPAELSWGRQPRARSGLIPALLGRTFDVGVAPAIPPDGGAKSVVQHRQQRFRPFRARLKGTSDGQPARGIIVELDLQGGVSHQLIDDLTQRLILEIESALSPGQPAAEQRRIELVDHLSAAVHVGLLTRRHGCRRLADRSIRWRGLVCCRIGDIDGAFAHRHFHPGRRQVDIERGTDGADPIVAGAHPKRPLRIMGYFEKRLAAFETNDTPALAVIDPYPAVGVEIERRTVRQRHRGLLTDRGLKAGFFLLLV